MTQNDKRVLEAHKKMREGVKKEIKFIPISSKRVMTLFKRSLKKNKAIYDGLSNR